MSRAFLILANDAIRAKAIEWIRTAPDKSRVELKEPRRTLPANARLWAMLTDVSEQVEWHGIKLGPDDWKHLFMDALKAELRMVPNINGNGFVNLGRSSSDLSVREFSDLMTLVEMFGAEHGVVFHYPEGRASA